MSMTASVSYNCGSESSLLHPPQSMMIVIGVVVLSVESIAVEEVGCRDAMDFVEKLYLC